ncbi:MAG: type II secretion system F family protein [Gemmatimonadaceae bacterium]|nr:type II secretion system F family protein [Gemmatimonadaceae bacterium]
MSITRVLDAFETLCPERWRGPLVDVRARVRNGASLATAIEQSSLRLPADAIGMIRAGEERGALAEAVQQAAAQATQDAQARSAVMQALSYPALLSAAGLATLAVMATVVLPRFSVLLEDAGVALPRSTSLLMATGDVAGRAALPLGLLAIAGGYAAAHVLQDAHHRERWHELLLNVPVVGALRRRLASARLTAILASLLNAGVSLPRALEIGAAALGDEAIRQRTLAARAAILGGQGLGSALAQTGTLTDTAQRLVGAGEAGGRLTEMLRHAAELDQRAALDGLRVAVRLIEPALVLMVGGLIALMAATLLQTMYALRP